MLISKHSIILVVAVLVLGFPEVAASTPQAPTPSALATKNREEKKAALNALQPLLGELLHLDNVSEKVKLAQPIIAMLWSSDPTGCRRLLSHLLDECIRLRVEGSSTADRSRDPDRLARKIIEISAKFDRKLAKKLLERYEDELTEEKTNSSTQSTAAKFKFVLASQLINENASLAAQIAETVIREPVIPETLAFLVLLREKDVVIANRLFALAVAGMQSRGGLDQNECLLLFSYVFSPRQIPYITAKGLAIYKLPGLDSLPDTLTEPLLAEQYLDAVIRLLLAPDRYSMPAAQPAFGAMGDWFVIRIIEAYVPRFRPQLGDSLLAQRSVLEGELQNRNSEDVSAFDRWRNASERRPAVEANDTVDALLKRANQAANSNQRDQLFYRAAMAAARAGQYDRAITIAGELSIDARAQAREYLNFEVATVAIRRGDFDRAVRLAEKDSDVLRRAYILTEVAKFLSDTHPSDVEQVRFYLSAVEGLVPRLDNDNDRVSVIAGIIDVYNQIDRPEAFKLLAELILYANKLKTFSGELAISRILEIGGFYFDYSLYQDQTIEDSLQPLATWNFEKTLEATRELRSASARIRATAAICKAVLTKTSV